MTAYVISRVTMKPGPALEAYRRLAAASIARHGGRYLARGGAMIVLEGEWRGALPQALDRPIQLETLPEPSQA